MSSDPHSIHAVAAQAVRARRGRNGVLATPSVKSILDAYARLPADAKDMQMLHALLEAKRVEDARLASLAITHSHAQHAVRHASPSAAPSPALSSSASTTSEEDLPSSPASVDAPSPAASDLTAKSPPPLLIRHNIAMREVQARLLARRHAPVSNVRAAPSREHFGRNTEAHGPPGFASVDAFRPLISRQKALSGTRSPFRTSRTLSFFRHRSTTDKRHSASRFLRLPSDSSDCDVSQKQSIGQQDPTTRQHTRTARAASASIATVSVEPSPTKSGKQRAPSHLFDVQAARDDSDNASISSIQEVLREQLEHDLQEKERAAPNKLKKRRPAEEVQHGKTASDASSDIKHEPLEAELEQQRANDAADAYVRPPTPTTDAHGITSPRLTISSRIEFDSLSGEHVSTPLAPDDELSLWGLAFALVVFPWTIPLRALLCLPKVGELVPTALTPVDLETLIRRVFQVVLAPLWLLLRFALGERDESARLAKVD